MDQRLIDLSAMMCEYKQRNILTPYSIDNIVIQPSPRGTTCLLIRCYKPSLQEIEAKIVENRTFIENIEKSFSKTDEAKMELQWILAQRQLERKVIPATIEAVTSDLICSIKNAGLIPRNFRLRYWVPRWGIPHADISTEQALVFLDNYKEERINDKIDTRFCVVQLLEKHIEVSHSEGKFYNAFEFSNLDILMAYAQNLQEGIKR